MRGTVSDRVTPDRRLLAAAPAVAGSALDLGCGAGGNAIALAEAGWEVTGVDLAPRAIGSARIAAGRRRVAVDFVVADITTWTPPQRYDFVLSSYALPPRGPGRTSALRTAVAALAPGGTIVITELDVSTARRFGTTSHFIDVDEMHAYLTGLDVVAVEAGCRWPRRLRPPQVIVPSPNWHRWNRSGDAVG